MKTDGLPRNYVGMPAAIELDLWAADVSAFFGHARPYLVGSATRGREFRDVDVRVMLWPDDWERVFPGCTPTGSAAEHDRGWRAICAAFSAWGRLRTGLPIDFQVQHADRANEREDGGRIPLGMDLARRHSEDPP